MMIEEERSMKKLIATALALTMTLSLSTTALAAGNVDGAVVGSQEPIDVTAKYNDSATDPIVYSVDLKWDDMTFTYNEFGTRTWDPDTHTYTDTTSAGWDKTYAAVTATNHSNVQVTVYGQIRLYPAGRYRRERLHEQGQLQIGCRCGK